MIGSSQLEYKLFRLNMADDEHVRSRSTDSSAINRDTRGTVTVHDEPVDGGEEVKVDAGQDNGVQEDA